MKYLWFHLLSLARPVLRFTFVLHQPESNLSNFDPKWILEEWEIIFCRAIASILKNKSELTNHFRGDTFISFCFSISTFAKLRGWVGYTYMYILWLLMGKYFLFIRNCWRSIFFYNGMRVGWKDGGFIPFGGLEFYTISINSDRLVLCRENSNKYVFVCGWKIQFEFCGSLIRSLQTQFQTSIDMWPKQLLIEFIHTLCSYWVSWWHSSSQQQQRLNWTFDGTTFCNWITKLNFPSF